jgi:hypothetical protein
LIQIVPENMKKLLSLIYFSIQITLFAQIQIVRDPIACAYGLKDAQNKWIVPAEYQQLILLDPGFYACQINEKWGIIRSNGTTMLKTKYDQISLFSPGRYMITNHYVNSNFSDQKTGIIDSTKNWIFPQEYSSITRMEKGHYLLIKSTFLEEIGLRYQSSIADSEGKLLFPFLDGVLLNRFYLSNVNIIGNSIIGSNTVSDNVRFVDALGILISDSIFDMAKPCGENFVVTKKGRYGLVNSEGKISITPKYQFERINNDYSNSLTCLHGHHQLIFIENGKQGILDGNWEEVIPATFDRISPLNSNAFPFSTGRYVGYKEENRKYHLFDQYGKMIAKVDTLFMKMIPIPKKDQYENQRYSVYYVFGERDNNQMRYGVLNESGSVILAADYSSLIFKDNHELIVLTLNSGTKIPEGYTLALQTLERGEKTPLEFIQKLKNTYLFGSNGNFYTLDYFENCNCWEQSYGYSLQHTHGNYTLLNTVNGGVIIHLKTNTIQEVKSINWQSENLPVVQFDNGFNLLHPTKGFLFKESQLQVNQQFSSVNRIWAQEQNGKWKIYDSLGKLRIQEEFDNIAHFWDIQIVQQNNKKGILDKECNWLLKPLFSSLSSFSKNLFVGATKSAHVCVFNLSNLSKLDTSFTSFRPIFKDPTSENLIYCLEKKGESYFFDQRGSQLQHSKQEILTAYWMQPNAFGNDFFVQCKEAEKIYLQLASQLAYTLFYPYFIENEKKNMRSITNGMQQSVNTIPYKFQVEHGTEKAISLLIFQPQNNSIELNNVSYHPRSKKSQAGFFESNNYILVKNSWKKVTFEDLFKPEKTSYQQAILEAIQNNPSLRIDCNNPEVLYAGATQFSFHPDGIKLYFFVDQPHAFQVILTREQVQTISSAEWILEWI